MVAPPRRPSQCASRADARRASRASRRACSYRRSRPPPAAPSSPTWSPLPCPALSCPEIGQGGEASLPRPFRRRRRAAERGGGGGGGARARAGAQVLDTLLALALQKGVPRSGCLLVPPRPAPRAPRAALGALPPRRPRPAPSRPLPPRRPSTGGPADLPAGPGRARLADNRPASAQELDLEKINVLPSDADAGSYFEQLQDCAPSSSSRPPTL
jgi:hypothetical protein